MLRDFPFFQAITCLLVVVHHASAKNSSTSCMVDWLTTAGIPSSKVADYDAKLAAGLIKMGSLQHLSPIVFRLLGITTQEHQNLILRCFSSKCRDPCKNNGKCTLSGGAYRCQCRDGFKGDRCEIDPCVPNPCIHQKTQSGTCRRDPTSGSGFTCNCTLGYEGKRCHIITNPCDSNPCLNRATCVFEGRLNEFRCVCGLHNYGKVCQNEWISRSSYESITSKLATTVKTVKTISACVSWLAGRLAGWKARDSCLYKAFKEKKSFQSAENQCVSYNGHLASIHSREEMEFVRGEVIRAISDFVWLGGSDRQTEGAWKWTDGTMWDYTEWLKKEPSDDLHPENEDCLEFWSNAPSDLYGSKTNGWNDLSCSSGYAQRVSAFVCKICF